MSPHVASKSTLMYKSRAGDAADAEPPDPDRGRDMALVSR